MGDDHDGLVAGTAWKTETAAVRPGLAGLPAPDDSADEVENGRFELTFAADAKLFDGRFSNNGWLQELPGPMTRMCWDNAALIGPSTSQSSTLILIRSSYGYRPY